MNKFFPSKIFFFIATLIAISVGLNAYYYMNQKQSKPISIKGLLPKSVSLKDFTLTDQNNNLITPEKLKGKWSIISIGYTHCPDICPTMLHKYQQVHQTLFNNQSPFAKDTQFIFVSIDPNRDTNSRLKEYLAYFNPDFIGLTGKNAQLKLFTESIYASFMPPDTSKDNYEVVHSVTLHILNKQGQLQALISPPYTAAEITNTYINIREYINEEKNDL